MLVTHVDYDSTLWALNLVNATGDFTQYGLKGIKNDHQRLTLVHADDDDDSQYFNPNTMLKWKTTEDTDPYPYLANDSLTNYSTPAAITYNRNLNNRRMLNVAINSIYVDDNGVGSFSFAARCSTRASTAVRAVAATTVCSAAGRLARQPSWPTTTVGTVRPSRVPTNV